MEKKKIETFIKKYHLGGLITKVRWTNENNLLKALAITDDKKLFAWVEMDKFTAFSGEVPISDTGKFKGMLGVLADAVSVELDVDSANNNRVRSIVLADDVSEVRFQSAEIVEKVPSVKNIPQFELEVKIDEGLVGRYFKAKSGLPDATTFTLVPNKKNDDVQLVLGFSKNNTSRITLKLDSKGKLNNPISFSSNGFKEILAANSECKETVLKVSEFGLSSIEFATDGFKSQYYMMKIETED